MRIMLLYIAVNANSFVGHSEQQRNESQSGKKYGMVCELVLVTNDKLRPLTAIWAREYIYICMEP